MKFNLNQFRSLLSQKNIFGDIEYFEEIDSTNTYLKNSENINGKLVIADFQTAGRGRFERKWISNKGENLTFSFGLENINQNLITKLIFYVPVILVKAIEKVLRINPEIKWPNDLLLNGKKFCGILIENIFEHNSKIKVVIGIGINCNQIEFPEGLIFKPTSLKKELNQEIPREILLAEIVNEFSKNWDAFLFNPDDFYHLYKSKCISKGKDISVSYNGKIYSGKFHDITPQGELVLLTENETKKFNSGEITIIKE